MRRRRPQHSKHGRAQRPARRADRGVSARPAARTTAGRGSFADLFASASVPAELFAVARRPTYHGRVVKVSVAGDDVLCLIGDEGGSPADWYAALCEYAQREPASSFVERHLPRGLRAVALRAPGKVLLCVSLLCTATEQKAAARRLLRAARKLGWFPAPVPAPLGRTSAHRLRASVAVGGTLVVGSAGVFTVLWLLHSAAPTAPVAGPQPQLFLSQPSQPHATVVSHSHGKHKRQSANWQPVPSPHSSKAAAWRPSPTPSPSTRSSSATPSRSSSPGPPRNSPSPNPRPSSSSPSSRPPSPRPSPSPSSPSPSWTPSPNPSSSPLTRPTWSPTLQPGGGWSSSSPLTGLTAARCWASPSGCGTPGQAGSAGGGHFRLGLGNDERDYRALPLIYWHF